MNELQNLEKTLQQCQRDHEQLEMVYASYFQQLKNKVNSASSQNINSIITTLHSIYDEILEIKNNIARISSEIEFLKSTTTEFISDPALEIENQTEVEQIRTNFENHFQESSYEDDEPTMGSKK